MIRTRKESHTLFCNYMVNKAKERMENMKQKTSFGLKTSGMTRNELIEALSK